MEAELWPLLWSFLPTSTQEAPGRHKGPPVWIVRLRKPPKCLLTWNKATQENENIKCLLLLTDAVQKTPTETSATQRWGREKRSYFQRFHCLAEYLMDTQHTLVELNESQETLEVIIFMNLPPLNPQNPSYTLSWPLHWIDPSLLKRRQVATHAFCFEGPCWSVPYLQHICTIFPWLDLKFSP